jgi:UDP-N-acetylglucosamine--N-acetylmuramyl-(pentapeptide) pyrophosphoryl-undecaprenol N-acetylglucosamine transferase
VLVFGGSQGAHAINFAMIEAAPLIARATPTPEIVHQTGARDLAEVEAGHERAGLKARTAAFLDDMPGEMAAADLIVSRAGATTTAEIAATGRASILIPLPTAADDHQRKNAEALAAAGAAEVIEQRDLTGARLAERILALTADAPRRNAMARAARRLARPDAAAAIVERVFALADARRRRRAGGG